MVKLYSNSVFLAACLSAINWLCINLSQSQNLIFDEEISVFPE
jgi:hypothetical protein